MNKKYSIETIIRAVQTAQLKHDWFIHDDLLSIIDFATRIGLVDRPSWTQAYWSQQGAMHVSNYMKFHRLIQQIDETC